MEKAQSASDTDSVSLCLGSSLRLMAFLEGKSCSVHTSGLIKSFRSQSENIYILRSCVSAPGSAEKTSKALNCSHEKHVESAFKEKSLQERGGDVSDSQVALKAPPAAEEDLKQFCFL